MRKALLCLAALALTTSCSGDVKSKLGLEKTAPDEFTVVSNPPLTLPPDFNLRPPEEKDSFSKSSPSILAYSERNTGVSKGEEGFLNKLGVDSRNNAHAMVDKDYLSQQKSKKEKGLIRSTLSSIRGDNQIKAIDPIAEKKRIAENLSTGKAVNEGETKLKSQSTLDRILGS